MSSKLSTAKIFIGALTMTYGAVIYGYEIHKLFVDEHPDKKGWNKALMVSGVVALSVGSTLLGDGINDLTMDAYITGGKDITNALCDGTLEIQKAGDAVKMIRLVTKSD